MVFFGFLFIFLLSVILFVSDRYTMKYVFMDYFSCNMEKFIHI